MPDVLEEPLLVETVSAEGGMNASDHPTELSSNQDVFLMNGHLGPRFTRNKRAGWTLVGAVGGYTPAAGTPVARYSLSGSVNYTFFNATAYRSTGNATPLTSLTASAAPSGTVEDSSRIYRLSTSENIFSCVTSGVACVDEGATNTSFPQCRQAIWTSTGRMLALDSTHGLYYSNALDAQTWDRTVQKLTISSPRNGKNVDMVEYKPGLVLIAVEDAVLELNISNPNPSFWTLTTKISDVVKFYQNSRHAMALAGQDVYLVGQSGIYSFLQLLASPTFPRPLSYELNLDLVGTGIYNLFVFKNRLFFYTNEALKTYDTFTVKAYEYDIETKRWSAFTSGTAGPWAGSVAEIYASKINLFVLGSDNGLYWGSHTDAFSDSDVNGTLVPITYLFETRAFFGGDITIKKIAEVFELTFTGDTAVTPTISYMIDESGSWTDLSIGVTALTGTSGKILKMKMPISSLGEWYTIRFRFKAVDINGTALVTTKVLACSVFYRNINYQFNY